MPDPVVHFEIPADNPERGREFYHRAFGWTVNSIPGMGYTLFHTTETDARGMVGKPGNINGGMLARTGPFQHPVLTVQVEDMTAALKRVEASGGRVVRAAQPVQGVGVAAYVADTEGNVVGLIQSTRA